jgi:glycosyltransferase involved in cell wall biosynthesis
VKVSVITPTANRERLLRGLYHVFDTQTWPDLELLVADDSPTASPFFLSLRDPRVQYFHFPEPMPLGEKRNFLVQKSVGEVIACFDDDDYYAPDYVASMLSAMGSADMVKLVGWFALSLAHNNLFYWDTSRLARQHYRVGPTSVDLFSGEQFSKEFVQQTSSGFGFSYVFKRTLFGETRYPAVQFAEDLAFAENVRALNRHINYVHDVKGLALHLLHESNSAYVYPQFWLPTFLLDKLFPKFQDYREVLATATP